MSLGCAPVLVEGIELQYCWLGDEGRSHNHPQHPYNTNTPTPQTSLHHINNTTLYKSSIPSHTPLHSLTHTPSPSHLGGVDRSHQSVGDPDTSISDDRHVTWNDLQQLRIEMQEKFSDMSTQLTRLAELVGKMNNNK